MTFYQRKLKNRLVNWRGVPLQLFTFTILPLTLVIIVISFGSLILHQRAMRTTITQRDERAARAAAAAITEQLNFRATTIQSLSRIAANSQPIDHVLDDASNFLPDFEGGLALYNNDLQLLATTNEMSSWEISGEISKLVVSSQASNQVLFSKPFLHPNFEQLFITAVAATSENITVVGIFYPDTVAYQALSNVIPPSDVQASAFITDQDGQLLFQFSDSYERGADLRQAQGVTEALRGESGTTYTTTGGDEYVIAFSPIPPVNWTLIIQEPWQAVAAPLLRSTESVPLILAPVLVIAMFGLMFGIRKIMQPLQALEKKASALSNGDFGAIDEPVGGIEEIKRLQMELMRMAQRLKVAQQSLRDYLGSVTKAQEEERRRIARDIHDDTIQSLIALNQAIQLFQMSVSLPETAEKLSTMQNMVEQIIADLRRLSRDLRPIYLEDLGLVTALDMLTRDSSKIIKIPIGFQLLGEEQRLAPDIELALYRMSQEGLSNIIRHSNATIAKIKLAFTSSNTQLIIQDNGEGFE